MIKIKTSDQRSSYDVKIGSGVLTDAGAFFRKRVSPLCKRIGVISNRTVSDLYGERLAASLRSAGFEVCQLNIGDGERFKTLRSAERVLGFLSENGFGRTDAIAALGGGVVGDLAGFAASIYLRGVDLIQVPTSLVAMVDSSVGGKTAVNSVGGKNTVGTFHHPRAVLIDTTTLLTLRPRELTSGYCEMIKHAALSGRQLFELTSDLICSPHDTGGKKIVTLLSENIAFKAAVVAADEREAPSNRTKRSRKILNFGHTLAHALEKATNYRYFRHGEAVGHGMLFAAELSKYIAFLNEECVNSLYDVVHRAGSLPPLKDIDPNEVFEAFQFDKKKIGGQLQFVLLKDIGKPLIVESNEISASILRQAYKNLLKNLP